ncbi:hypothetical protein FA10DRAFT_265560 [Acaromyces ingoldii]|uniref:Ubiquitin-like domain-containing protein n=1 Tax=Acaromyces ingoldii TaxID=215250 RepID=A0A316YVG0_9BASI|nr:hypothetical protein FA10DRAFT_265560 [Acaromyces ingoldii]PWN91715.1 hypothetical protein FA10DRAFT_265560 [Acaromyces ingoldii]
MTSMIPSKSADSHLEPSTVSNSVSNAGTTLPRMTQAPIRKTISLSSIFREKRRPRSSSLLPPDELEQQDGKRKKKPSQRSFSPSSPTQPYFSSQPESTSSSSSVGRWHGRLSRVVPFHNAPPSSPPPMPIPSRPACPAPLLDLSAFDEDDEHAFLPRHDLDPKALLSLQAATAAASSAPIGSVGASGVSTPLQRSLSQESFHCRGLDLDFMEGYGAAQPRLGGDNVAKGMETMTANTRPVSMVSLDTLDSLSSVSSSASSVWSDAYSTLSSRMEMTSPFQCPPSPPPQLNLVFIMPKDIVDEAPQRVEIATSSSDSVLELKEHVSRRLDCSPRSLALVIASTSDCDEPTDNRRRLDNDRALYEEGLQDNDEIIVELLPHTARNSASTSACYAKSFF